MPPKRSNVPDISISKPLLVNLILPKEPKLFDGSLILISVLFLMLYFSGSSVFTTLVILSRPSIVSLYSESTFPLEIKKVGKS